MSAFVMRDRKLSFELRQEVESLVDDVVEDPEGAAWTIVVLRELLERNGLRVEVLRG